MSDRMVDFALVGTLVFLWIYVFFIIGLYLL
jgi:hypothetical protein